MSLARYLGLIVSAEQALVDAWALVAARHAGDPEIRNGARLYGNWSKRHLELLRPTIERSGFEYTEAGDVLGRALFRGRRQGGLGLLRDLHDLSVLATHVYGCWTVLHQAARELRQQQLEAAWESCQSETVRQLSWLDMKIRQAAPQAVTVPPNPRRQFLSSRPSLAEFSAILDLIPGPAMRRVLPEISALVVTATWMLSVGKTRGPARVTQDIAIPNVILAISRTIIRRYLAGLNSVNRPTGHANRDWGIAEARRRVSALAAFRSGFVSGWAGRSPSVEPLHRASTSRPLRQPAQLGIARRQLTP